MDDRIIIKGLRQMNETYSSWVRGRLPKFDQQTDFSLKRLSELFVEKTCPDGGTKGGRIVFTGTPREMVERGMTITSEFLRKSLQ